MQYTTVEIYLDKKRIARRDWAQVPRVGDFIRLSECTVTAQVVRVYWSDLGMDKQFAQLVCETRD